MATFAEFSEVAVVTEQDSLLRRFFKSAIPALLTTSLVLTPVMISRPAVAANDAAQATMEGGMDAKANEGGALWFFAGCLGPIGILIAYVIEPSPPPTRIMGKSSDYVTAYTAAYKSAGKSAQGKMAIIGCLVLGAVEILIYVIYVMLVVSTVTSVATTTY